jgi:DNA-directed RNA polymerase alpha subunit
MITNRLLAAGVKDGAALSNADIREVCEELLARRKQVSYQTWATGNKSIELLELTVRSYNCLTGAKIWTVGHLMEMTPSSLLAIKNLGIRSLRNIEEALATLGVGLKASGVGPETEKPDYYDPKDYDLKSENDGLEDIIL